MASSGIRPVSYGNCSTFFTETQDDHGIYIRRLEQRKHAQAQARQTQRALAEELSNVTSDEYQDEILHCMEQTESETLPDVSSIDIQTEIQWYMRSYLMDFLIEAHAAFQLQPETLHLTINLMDRYCSRRVVYKRHYQLVGCATLLIAAKYGDRKERVPTIRELKSMCCSMYEEEMFTQMEWHILVTLNWVVGHPTVDSFLQIALSREYADTEAEYMASYICELALFHRDFVSIPPSVMARASLGLTRYILQRPLPDSVSWDDYYACPTFMALARMVQLERSSVVSSKYSSPRLCSVCQTMDYYLMHQAHLQRQQANITPITNVKHKEHEYPHTPQKDHAPSEMPYGYATPPITPEGLPYVADGASKARASMCAGQNLTPPSSAIQYRSSPLHPQTVAPDYQQTDDQYRMVYN